jgi:hypothetical protein
MRDLDETLKLVERNSPPDLWPVVRDRELGALPPTVPHARRWSTILVAAVVSILALGFAWRVFGETSQGPGDGPSVISSPSVSSSTPPVTETISVRDETEAGNVLDSGEFAPPPAGAQPALSADEALTVFFDDQPGIKFDGSDILSTRVGSYTAVDAKGSYVFRERLAYGIELHVCASQAPPSCDLWIFLDADTGHMLESSWRE